MQQWGVTHTTMGKYFHDTGDLKKFHWVFAEVNLQYSFSQFPIAISCHHIGDGVIPISK